MSAPPQPYQHLIVPFASAAPAAVQQALVLPQLHALLTRLHTQPMQRCATGSLATAHEYAIWNGVYPSIRLFNSDRQGIPFAHWLAQHIGLTGTGWGILSLCHWQIGMDSAYMAAPSALADLPHAEADTLFSAIQPWLEQDGLHLHALPANVPLPYPHAHLHRLISGAALAQTTAASLLRVAGQPVQHWLTRTQSLHTASHSHATLAMLRLQNELQMLLHDHPINEARLARGAATVNAVWISGTGTPDDIPTRTINPFSMNNKLYTDMPTHTDTQDTVTRAMHTTTDPNSASTHTASPPSSAERVTTAPSSHITICHHLTDAALDQDWSSWARAWQTLDNTILATASAQNTPPAITLCSLDAYRTWEHSPHKESESLLQQWRRRLMQHLHPTPVATTGHVLEELR